MTVVKNSLLRKGYIIVFGIILLELFIMVQWCRVKDFYDGDEMFSYSLANGNYTPFLRWNDDWWEEWHDVKYLTEQLTVDSNEAFNYESVFYNQENDVHPPLFYCVLHTVCSINQGVFSKWLGLSINLLCYGITLFLIWRITSFYILDERLAILPMIIYGISAGAVSTVVYIRMYMMLTLLSTLDIYLHCLLFSGGTKTTFLKKIALYNGLIN